jgi:Kef-type K+ transport system membrane component KefB
MIVPVPSYTSFFAGSAGVSGALVGLLFVALSVSPERLKATRESAEHQAIAATAFTALTDALFLSMSGLLPGNGTQTASLVLGVISLSSTVGLIVRLWQARSGGTLSRRWPVLLVLIFAVYATQAATSFIPSTTAQAHSLAAVFVFILFAVGIARSWELLGLRGGGVLDLLVARVDKAATTHRSGKDAGKPADASD